MAHGIECCAVDPHLAEVVEKAFTLPPKPKSAWQRRVATLANSC